MISEAPEVYSPNVDLRLLAVSGELRRAEKAERGQHCPAAPLLKETRMPSSLS